MFCTPPAKQELVGDGKARAAFMGYEAASRGMLWVNKQFV